MTLTAIDYTATPLPANGNPRSAPALASVFSNIQTVYNTMAAAASSGNTVSSVAQRDANGGIQFTYIGLIPTGALTGVNIAAPTGYTGTPITYSVNGVARSTVGNDGSVTAPAFHGPADSVAALGVTTAAIAANAVTGAKVATKASGVALANIADGAVSAHGTPDMAVAVAPYYYYNSTNSYSTPGGTSPTYPALPTGSNQRFDLLYTDDAFTLGWQVGTAALSSPPLPTLAVGSTAKPLAWVGPVTATTTAITASMIFEARPSPTVGLGSGAGGGGGTGMTTADRAIPFVTVGSDPNLTNETDIGVYLGDGRGVSGLKTGTADASIVQAFRNFVPADLPGRIAVISSTAVQVAADVVGTSTDPAVIGFHGRWRINTVPVSATASGAAGFRYVVAETAPGSPPTGAQWTLVSPLPTTPPGSTGTQVLLATVWWDGSAIQSGILDLSPLANLDSKQLTLGSIPAATNSANDTINAATFNSSILAKPTNMGVSQDFSLPVPMRARFRHSVLALSQAVLASGQYTFVDIGLAQNGGAYSSALTLDSRIYFGAENNGEYQKKYGFGDVTLAAGRWSFTQLVGYTGAAGDTTNWLFITRKVELDLYRG